MAETKYGKYFIKEPIERGPMLHICGAADCRGAQFLGFPVEMQLLCIKEARLMIEKPHSHEVDELFFIFGGDPNNYVEFGAEIEIYMGEEQEKHIVDCTTILYIPKGVVHCPINIVKVDKPVQWMHVLFQGKYQVSDGDLTDHPADHKNRYSYEPDEIMMLRQGITEGIKHRMPRE